MALSKNKLKEYRENARLSQERMAEMVTVSRQIIIFIEKGRYIPSLELALNSAKLFDCRVEDMFGL